MSRVTVIHERRVTGRRLGRHIEHDPRSKAFAIKAPVDATPIVSKVWTRHAPIFDQGDLGKCTCEAAGGCAMTEPLFVPGRLITDVDTTALYTEATKLDRIPGQYPPDDTGSTGLAAAKAATRRGWFSRYEHAFSLAATLRALQSGPVMIGINWYEGFDRPVGLGAELQISGSVRGGHEMEVLGIDVERALFRIANSWGESFGDHGYVTMAFGTLDRLLHEWGDVTIPLR